MQTFFLSPVHKKRELVRVMHDNIAPSSLTLCFRFRPQQTNEQTEREGEKLNSYDHTCSTSAEISSDADASSKLENTIDVDFLCSFQVMRYDA